MDQSLTSEALSCIALLLVFFIPLAIANAREIRAWWRDVSGPLS